MKKNITYPYDADRLTAITHYMGKKDLSLEADLIDFTDKAFEKHVPKDVREFLAAQQQPAPAPKAAKPKAPVPQAEPMQDADAAKQAQEGSATDTDDTGDSYGASARFDRP